MATLSLHQLTALDATPVELIGIAGRLGCDHVCLFTHVPAAARHVYPIVTGAGVPAIGEALSAAGVMLSNLEVFPLDGTDTADLDVGLTVGVALGASRATAHIHAADFATAVARFAAFADRAAAHGIIAGLEFNAFSVVRTMAEGAAIVRAAGRGSLVLDTLHLMRGGGGAGDVAALADPIGYAQLSDGPATIPDPDRWREAVGERMLPGEGDFPLAAILAALPGDIVIEVEVPQRSAIRAGVDAETRCARAVAATRRVMGASR